MLGNSRKKIDHKALDELENFHNNINNLLKDNNVNENNKNEDITNVKQKESNEKFDKTTEVSSGTNDELSNVVNINEFKPKELMHYKKLDNFFNSCTSNETQIMVDIINGNHLVSLRFLDWFVTRYCYLYKLAINVNNSYIKQDDFNINISYKAQLKSFKKKYFDPFRRKKKFYYVCEKNNLVILTTIGQLNFFRWAISYDIIKYTETNYRNIIAKLSHVNTYFKKHIVENSSFSTSDDKNDLSKSNSDTNETKSILSSETKSSSDVNQNSKQVNKKDKKDKKVQYRNPIVSRNIILEL